MAIGKGIASSPKTRKARTSGMVQASTTLIYNGTDEDNLIGQRVQRLARLFGISGSHARTIAALAWEGSPHG